MKIDELVGKVTGGVVIAVLVAAGLKELYVDAVHPAIVSVLDVATRIATPLMVIGLAVIVFLVLMRAFLQLGIFAQLTPNLTYHIMTRFLRYVMIFASIAVVVGAVLFLIKGNGPSTTG
jgi:hypothetical protein